MLRMGSFVTVIVRGQSRGTIGADDLLSGVASALSLIPLQVTNSSISTPDIITGIVTGQWLHYEYVATVTVKTPIDYGSGDDVASIVAHAFESVTDTQPSSYAQTNTQAVDTTGGAPAVSWWDSLWAGTAALGAGVQSDIHWLLVGIVAIVVVLVFAIAWGPNSQHLVAAAA